MLYDRRIVCYIVNIFKTNQFEICTKHLSTKENKNKSKIF